MSSFFKQKISSMLEFIAAIEKVSQASVEKHSVCIIFSASAVKTKLNRYDVTLSHMVFLPFSQPRGPKLLLYVIQRDC